MNTPLLRCSFCNNDQEHVKHLIAGPDVFICDECIAIAAKIVEDARDKVLERAMMELL